MDGVNIINEHIFYQTESWLPAFFIGYIATIVICALIGYFVSKKDQCFMLIGALIGLLVGVLIGGAAFVATERPTSEIDYIIYDVTISDEVRFNEFDEKYEIISRNGNIYTVKERK